MVEVFFITVLYAGFAQWASSVGAAWRYWHVVAFFFFITVLYAGFAQWASSVGAAWLLVQVLNITTDFVVIFLGGLYSWKTRAI